MPASPFHAAFAAWTCALGLAACGGGSSGPGAGPDPSPGAESEWVPTFGSSFGTDNPLLAFQAYDDGSGRALFVGGSFFSAGASNVGFLARWDGFAWSGLGAGVDDTVRALAVFEGAAGPELHAGGLFTLAGGAPAAGVARWNGERWQPLGAGVDGGPGGGPGNVTALVVHDDGTGPALYVGGEFLSAGGAAAPGVARWDGAGWSAVGAGLDGPVRALAVWDGGAGPRLVAGGRFVVEGERTPCSVALLVGDRWWALRGTELDPVFGLTVFDGGAGAELFAVGVPATAGGACVRRFDGSAWSTPGSAPSGAAFASFVFEDPRGALLCVGGELRDGSGAELTGPLGWDGARWSPLGAGLDSNVLALGAFDHGTGPRLYAGGFFTSSGAAILGRIAAWDGRAWEALGAGLDGAVRAVAVLEADSGPTLVAGGNFTRAGSRALASVARWDGRDWSPLGAGLDAFPAALTLFDDGLGRGAQLHAGGPFTDSGGARVRHVARWDGAAWQPLGVGMNGIVEVLLAFDDGTGPALYAGGTFTQAGGAPARRIARWDGAAWSSLAGGAGGSNPFEFVGALAAFDEGTGSGPELFLGGGFLVAGGVDADHVARWDGGAFHPLGAGTDGPVYALVVHDDGSGAALYAGGAFEHAGEVAALSIARWDGREWSALGPGLDGPVFALAVHDDGSGPALFAGGSFEQAGELPARHVARWDGASWSALDGGVDGPVASLASAEGMGTLGEGLFVGGLFLRSGGGDSFLARWGGAERAARERGVAAASPAWSATPPRRACALTPHLDPAGRLDASGARLVLAEARIAPGPDFEWIAGTIELCGGRWRQDRPLELGFVGPARLVLRDGARLEVPALVIGPLGEVVGSGRVEGDLVNHGSWGPTGVGIEVAGSYRAAPGAERRSPTSIHTPARTKAW